MSDSEVNSGNNTLLNGNTTESPVKIVDNIDESWVQGLAKWPIFVVIIVFLLIAAAALFIYRKKNKGIRGRVEETFD